MPINQPLPRVTIAGDLVPGVTFLRVESVGALAADRYEIRFAMGGGLAQTISYFSALQAAPISIDLSLIGGFTNLITGQVDNIRLDLLESTAVLSGRDLSARFIDAELAEAFNNQTSSQIAATLAGRHGLAANVTTTSTPVGQYYELDHTRSAAGLHSRLTTEWNLLAQLAQLEGFSLSVVAETLNFGPPAPPLPVFVTPQDMMTLDIDIATTLPTAATVKSWNTRNKMAVTQTAGASSATVLVRPNLTAAQAGTVAQNHLATLSRHKTILRATMPGDVSLTPAAPLVLSGTGSPLDQVYIVDRVARTLDGGRGFIQSIRAYADAA